MDDTLANDASASVGVVQRAHGKVVVTAAGLTDIGRHRQVNQDALGNLAGHFADRHDTLGLLYAIADGMGGHSRGEIASDLAIKYFFSNYYASPVDQPAQAALSEALMRTNAAVHEAGKQVGGSNMGTTLTAALFRNDKLYIGNVGDSRTYRIRNGHIQQLTQDHSLIGEQVRSGLLSASQARQSNIRNVITRAVGYREEVRPDTFEFPVTAGETILLCSDGLHGLLEDQEIAEIITNNELEAAVKALVALSCDRGAPDNVTALAIRVDEAPDDDQTIEITAPNVVLPHLRDDETVPFPSLPATNAAPLSSSGDAPAAPAHVDAAGPPGEVASDFVNGSRLPRAVSERGAPPVGSPAATSTVGEPPVQQGTPTVARQSRGAGSAWFAGLGALLLVAVGGGALYVLVWSRSSWGGAGATATTSRASGAEVGPANSGTTGGTAPVQASSPKTVTLSGKLSINGVAPAEVTQIGLFSQPNDPMPLATGVVQRSADGTTGTYAIAVSQPLQPGKTYFFRVLNVGPGPQPTVSPNWVYEGGSGAITLDLTVGR